MDFNSVILVHLVVLVCLTLGKLDNLNYNLQLSASRPDFVKSAVDNFHYLHFSAFSLLVSGLVGVVVSLLTPAIEEDKLYRLTFQSR